jgi:trans-AT polyketide synthase, acyltransferase and oxidoreductase domains
MQRDSSVQWSGSTVFQHMRWNGPPNALAGSVSSIWAGLGQLGEPCYLVRQDGQIGLANQGELVAAGAGAGGDVLSVLPPLPLERLGDPSFLRDYGVRMAYFAGGMANGISSEGMVIALGRENILGCFGAAGLTLGRVDAAISTIQAALPAGPYVFNLIHSPFEDRRELDLVELYLRRGVRVIEASAFMDISPALVRFRAAGLELTRSGRVQIHNRIIAKISRREVAAKFMEPAPARILSQLLESGQISAEQARLAERVPLADDITVEADSGGHTDNRPLVCLMPAMVALRDEIQARYQYEQPVRIGAAGGIGTPAAALAALSMGAAYIVTGSINQASVEAGTSQRVKELLAQSDMADVTMAPAADMFELGVRVQVLKRGTMFAVRAQKLAELYRQYPALDDIPAAESERLERQIFQKSIAMVWDETQAFFAANDPQQLAEAAGNPKHKMALVFRWYLGLSSSWAHQGVPGREMDYQIWCGPAIGAFNSWARGGPLERVDQRRVVDVALHLMSGAAIQHRAHTLRAQGLALPTAALQPIPELAPERLMEVTR